MLLVVGSAGAVPLPLLTTLTVDDDEFNKNQGGSFTFLALRIRPQKRILLILDKRACSGILKGAQNIRSDMVRANLNSGPHLKQMAKKMETRFKNGLNHLAGRQCGYRRAPCGRYFSGPLPFRL